MKYEEPMMWVMILESNNISTLTVSNGNGQNITDPDGENPWD